MLLDGIRVSARSAGGQRPLIGMSGSQVAQSNGRTGMQITLICISRIDAARRCDLRQIGGSCAGILARLAIFRDAT
jgi:hypothetical protein